MSKLLFTFSCFFLIPLSALDITEEERKALGYIDHLTESQIEWLIEDMRTPPEDIEVSRARWKKLQEKKWIPLKERNKKSDEPSLEDFDEEEWSSE